MGLALDRDLGVDEVEHAMVADENEAGGAGPVHGREYKGQKGR